MRSQARLLTRLRRPVGSPARRSLRNLAVCHGGDSRPAVLHPVIRRSSDSARCCSMRRGQVRHFRRGTLLVAVTVVLLVTAVGTGLAASTNNWPSYLFNSEPASSTSATSSAAANARSLQRAGQLTGDSRSVSGQ